MLKPLLREARKVLPDLAWIGQPIEGSFEGIGGKAVLIGQGGIWRVVAWTHGLHRSCVIRMWARVGGDLIPLTWGGFSELPEGLRQVTRERARYIAVAQALNKNSVIKPVHRVRAVSEQQMSLDIP